LRLRKDGFGSRDAALYHFELGRVVQLLGGFLHAHTKVGFLQLFDFHLQASGIFLA
jgi:hypothetical protein